MDMLKVSVNAIVVTGDVLTRMDKQKDFTKASAVVGDLPFELVNRISKENQSVIASENTLSVKDEPAKSNENHYYDRI